MRPPLASPPAAAATHVAGAGSAPPTEWEDRCLQPLFKGPRPSVAAGAASATTRDEGCDWHPPLNGSGRSTGPPAAAAMCATGSAALGGGHVLRLPLASPPAEAATRAAGAASAPSTRGEERPRPGGVRPPSNGPRPVVSACDRYPPSNDSGRSSRTGPLAAAATCATGSRSSG